MRSHILDVQEFKMLKCACGGQFENQDPIFATEMRNHGQVVYDQRRLFPGFATRRCSKCHKLRKQKLRVSKKAPDVVLLNATLNPAPGATH